MTLKQSILRTCAPLLGALLLSACGEGVGSELGKTVVAAFEGGGEPRPEPTRAQLNEIPSAMIAVRRTDSKRAAFLRATAYNDGYVTYYTRAGNSFTLRGAAVTGHHGIGFDLMGFNSSPGDPLVTPTPLADWPRSVDRVYQMRSGDGRIYTRGVVCTPIIGDAVKLEIKEIIFDVVAVEDRCRSGALAFSNQYWVAADTGFVWKSVQWTGPQMFPLDIEIIRPFAE